MIVIDLESWRRSLFVWHEPVVVTADAARLKVEQRDLIAPHPSVGSSGTRSRRGFPEPAGDGDDQARLWFSTLQSSESLVGIGFDRTDASGIHGAVKELAAEHGLVCYDPGYHVVEPNVPGYVPAFSLTLESFPPVPDPDAERLEWALAKLGPSNSFARLSRPDGWFAQVGYGQAAGVRPGTYALEYCEGPADRRFRAHTTDRVVATRFLQESFAGDATKRGRHSWQAVDD